MHPNKKYTVWTIHLDLKIRPQLRPYWDCFCYTIETQMCQCSGDFEQKLWGLQHCCKRGPHNGVKSFLKKPNFLIQKKLWRRTIISICISTFTWHELLNHSHFHWWNILNKIQYVVEASRLEMQPQKWF